VDPSFTLWRGLGIAVAVAGMTFFSAPTIPYARSSFSWFVVLLLGNIPFLANVATFVLSRRASVLVVVTAALAVSVGYLAWVYALGRADFQSVEMYVGGLGAFWLANSICYTIVFAFWRHSRDKN
jgi:hypothetical protein